MIRALAALGALVAAMMLLALHGCAPHSPQPCFTVVGVKPGIIVLFDACHGEIVEHAAPVRPATPSKPADPEV